MGCALDGKEYYPAGRTDAGNGVRTLTAIQAGGGEMNLYTKNGRPLQVSGETVYSRSGQPVLRIQGNKVYGTNGQYVGTSTDDRLVYRSTDSAAISSPFSVANRAGCGMANRGGSGVWGDEPNIPD